MSRFLRCALVLAVLSGPGIAVAADAWSPARDRTYVITSVRGELVCSAVAVPEPEAGPAVRVHQINHLTPQAEGPFQRRTGLTITLRGTAQLDGFPDAKNAFIRAAAAWEATISNPIAVIIDVDFGPNRFGTPFPAGVLGSTNSDNFGGSYPSVRTALLATFPTSPIYTALPTGTVPTDLGAVANVVAPSSVLRAIALLPSAADPSATAPSIGFNSAFSYDFNPADGIDPGRRDFEAVASHEIGHVLGFSSRVGATELDANAQLAVSLWDIFRFRPGTGSALGTASRILSSGGSQVFSRGGSDANLSTGRPDGTGGDGQQASHWKDDSQTGQWIGIMDPTLQQGVHPTTSYSDLLVLDAIGYTVAVNPAAVVSSIVPPTVPQYSAGATVTVNGSGFLPGATATLDGRLIPTRVISPSVLSATVPMSALFAPTSRSLLVQNPAALPSTSLPLSVTQSAGCPAEAHTLCLNGNRFLVRADWQTSDGDSGHGTAVSLTPDTGYFWFFSASNVELVTKVLNGCGFNSRYWVFAGGLTNVQVIVTVVDTQNGTTRQYVNPQGTAFAPIQDTAALATCP